jgi:large subunit ribosomal protein L25
MSTATSSRPSLAAEPRSVTGKKVATIRRDGKLPAVVYGHGVDSENLAIDAHEFELLRRHAGQNALIELSVHGRKSRPVLVHDVQVHPVNRKPIHVDLFLVRMTEELTVDVRLIATGSAQAIERDGGTLLHPIENVRIRALPDHLPQSIEYSIDSLVDFDAVIKVSDLAIPEDVTLLTEADEVVAKVLPSRLQAEEAALEAEEAEAAAEVAEGEAPAEPAAEGEAPAAGGAGGEATGESPES